MYMCLVTYPMDGESCRRCGVCLNVYVYMRMYMEYILPCFNTVALSSYALAVDPQTKNLQTKNC